MNEELALLLEALDRALTRPKTCPCGAAARDDQAHTCPVARVLASPTLHRGGR